MDIIAREQAKIASQIFYCLVKSVDKSLNVCTIVLENKEYTVPFYGGAPIPNRIYSVFLPQNNMNLAFVVGEAVAKTGDTMTGNLEVVRNQEANIYVENTKSGQEHRVALCAGTSGRGGIYDETFSKWLVYYDKNGALGLGTPLPIGSGGTDATTQTQALLNLQAYDLNRGTSIPANANLNTYTTVGAYYCSSNVTAETLTNCPTSLAFKMVAEYIISSTYIRQTIMSYSSNTVWTRVRTSSSTWTSWRRLLDTNDLLLEETHTFTASAAAGTIGTRGAQLTYTPSYGTSKIASIVVSYVNSSIDFHPFVFYSGSTVYCNIYRATSSAFNAEVKAKILYYGN